MNKETKQLPKRHNANSGDKAHLDNKAYKVGRIRRNSWANKVLKAYDIVVYESELVHILKYHEPELNGLGFTPFDYVLFVLNNFNAIYQGKNDAKILVYKPKSHTAHRAIIELVFDGKQYKIKTASPIKTERLIKMKLLCANPRRVSY